MITDFPAPTCCTTTPLTPGTRVHLWGQQWPTAISAGTATIEQVLRHHRIDHTYEYRVLTDDGDTAQWNHVVAV